jgi:hypothetical protein|tara:strand:- start:2703 stop:2834 length:132 start_codon:yes stop_codon:yes gene_type:complete
MEILLVFLAIAVIGAISENYRKLLTLAKYVDELEGRISRLEDK